MVRDIIYQISVFGDFVSIKPNPETIQMMIVKFSDYGLIPSIFQEGTFPIFPVSEIIKTETMNRLQMVSIEKSINVMFASNRIDINRASTDLNVGITNDDLSELLDILSKAVSGISSTRIGFNVTSLLDNPGVSLMQKIEPNLTFYDNSEELMLRVNKRSDVTLDDSSENSNVILTLQKTMGQILISNRSIPIDDKLVLQFDINTIPEVSEPRFFYEQIKKYVLSAEKIRKNISTDLISEEVYNYVKSEYTCTGR